MSDSFFVYWNILFFDYIYGFILLVVLFFFFYECVCVCLDYILFCDVWDKYDFLICKKNVLEIFK